MLAVSGQRTFDDGLGTRDYRRDLCARFEKARGLAINDIQIATFRGAGITGIHQLQHFAFCDHVGGIRHDRHDPRLTKPNHHLEGA